MGAIFRREVLSYFTSPIGYIFLAAFYACSAVSFTNNSLSHGTTQLDAIFGELMIILIVLIPILTMRTLSEEKKNRTDQCLLTSPVSLGGIVAGKFFAAFLIYAMGVAITLVYAVIVSAYAEPDWTVIAGNITGLLLLGAAFIAVGMFCSSLTENQVVSAVVSFIVMLALYLFTTIGEVIPVDFIRNIFPTLAAWQVTVIVDVVIAAVAAAIYFAAGRRPNTVIIAFVAMLVVSGLLIGGDKVPEVFAKLSFWERYYGFTYGLFDLSNVLFFVSAAVVFLFLSVRVLEKRRWA